LAAPGVEAGNVEPDDVAVLSSLAVGSRVSVLRLLARTPFHFCSDTQPQSDCFAAGSSPTVPPLPGLPLWHCRSFSGFLPPSPAMQFRKMDEASFSFRAARVFGKPDYG
jgi:hypothetical protein